jgi:molybdate transport system substrate-binding protein
MRRLWSLLLVLLLAACTSVTTPEASAPAPSGGITLGGGVTLNVFAAASLTAAFGELAADFSVTNPGVLIVYNFAGSNQLAQQIVEGAPADVFASANAAQMNVAIEVGRITSGTAQIFVRNQLVVVTPAENPAGITTLQDLARPGVKVVFAAEAVPVGQYSLDFLDKAEAAGSLGAGYKEAVLANIVSYEENVRAVLTKVTLGEADAGIVYTSDVTLGASDEVQRMEIPADLNTIASYPIAPLTTSANPVLAQAFIDYVLSPAGQEILVKHGFLPAAEAAAPAPLVGLATDPMGRHTDVQ